MNLEETYGKLWRASAKAEGHKGKMPSLPPQPKSETQIRIDIKAAVAAARLNTIGIKEAVGASHKTVQNNLYQMRAAGVIHSRHDGPNVYWHLGPKPVEPAFKSRRAAA